MRLALAFLMCATTLFGAIQGTVINKTSGQPQPGVTVTLTRLGQGGMQPGGSATTDAQGRFSIDEDAASAHILQAVWQGVSYNLSLQQGTSARNLELAVFDASPKVSAVEVMQHMILIETNGEELVVNETVIYQNDSQTTWFDPKEGTVRVSVPDGVAEVRARVVSPGGLPVERPLKRGKGVVAIDAPVKPGETRFDFTYRVAVKEPITLAGRIYHESSNVRFVIPDGIGVQGDGLENLGVEPRTRATVYGLNADSYKLSITGTGQLSAAEPQPDEGSRISVIAPPGYDRVWKWALGLTLAFLALGFWAQYLKSPQAAAPGAPGGKRKA